MRAENLSLANITRWSRLRIFEYSRVRRIGKAGSVLPPVALLSSLAVHLARVNDLLKEGSDANESDRFYDQGPEIERALAERFKDSVRYIEANGQIQITDPDPMKFSIKLWRTLQRELLVSAMQCVVIQRQNEEIAAREKICVTGKNEGKPQHGLWNMWHTSEHIQCELKRAAPP